MEGLNAILTALAEQSARVAELERRLGAVEGLRDQMHTLAEQLAALQIESLGGDDEGRAGHLPMLTPRWHDMTDQERTAELAKVRGFLAHVLVPLFGHLATIGPCWEQHPLACIVLDVAAELWKYLWLADRRTPAILSGQADYLTRLLPGLMAIVAKETRTCQAHLAKPDANGQLRSAVA